MKILPVSDLHFEFHADGGGSFVKDLNKDVDVLVAAGDIAVGEGILGALKLLCAKFKQVVYLPGNHEYYGTTRRRVTAILERACDKHGNFHWLRPGHTAVIDDQRFIGGTLWFPEPPPGAPKQALNDYHQIKDFESWVYEENQQTVKLLEQTVRPTDIVVTHHLPSQKSVAAEYEDSPLNPFFVCDMSHVIVKKQPKLWIHGHTHASCDYEIEHESGHTTHVVCNPFGYARREENPRFNPNLVIEVS